MISRFKFPNWGADCDFGGLVDAFGFGWLSGFLTPFLLRLGRFGIGCGGLNGFFLPAASKA